MIPSPNIWQTPEVYEIENLASDRAGVIEAAMDELHPFGGARLLDVGCGTGFHLPRLAELAEAVVGVEPHAPLARSAWQRVCRVGSPAQVVRGGAEAIPLADNCIDIAHARWAYFFGSGCEPGIAELARVLRPGGTAILIDNDATCSTFGSWFQETYPAYDPAAVQRFWDRQGFATRSLTIQWTFDSAADFAAVIAIEFPTYAAERILSSWQASDPQRPQVDYAVALRWRTF